jgi:hypothetical protein
MCDYRYAYRFSPRQNRLCWLSQKRPEKRSHIQRSKAKETESIPLVKCPRMALEIDRRDLTNRVRTSFTSVRTEADRVVIANMEPLM